MREYLDFYIDGTWVKPLQPNTVEVTNPADEQVAGRISFGSAADIDQAVQAARKAFPVWSATSREERIGVLTRVLEEYARRQEEMAQAITEEMGAPQTLARPSPR